MAKDIRELLRFEDALPDPRATPGVKSKGAAAKSVRATSGELAELQEKLFANGKLGDPRRVLLVLQGMDASGKDGVVKHVVGQVNPAGCRISSFGQPTEEELAQDFLWRITKAAPGPGMLGVFNRSHYEDVLIVRVHNSVPRSQSSRRFARINSFEKSLAGSGCLIVKVFLHISPDEQQRRLLSRLDDKTKHWKIGATDVAERRRWEDYQAAYLEALTRCSTDVAPWYVVPSDRKWYRDWAVSQLLLTHLRELDLTWPTPADVDLKAMRKELLGP